MSDEFHMNVCPSEGGQRHDEAEYHRWIWCQKLIVLLDDLTFGTARIKTWPSRIDKNYRPESERLHFARRAKVFFEGRAEDSFDESCNLAGIDPDIFFQRAKKCVRRLEEKTGKTLDQLLS